ncbi:MAG: XdhC family protein [Bacteroidales bacterium]|jgi:xanthine dehydrogenase accessory factor|nr:XdhC family protein [Bacteroidales bacterium]
MNSIYLKILEFDKPGSGLVLATVTGSAGSTPQKSGSSALFDSGNLVAGTVGGGIVENTVQEYAWKIGHTKESAMLRLQMNSDISQKDKAICGGEISVLIDANPSLHFPVFSEISKSISERIPGVLLTMVIVNSESQVLIKRYWMTLQISPAIPDEFMEKIEPEVRRILTTGNADDFRRMELTIPGEEPSSLFFLEPVFPLPQLVIAGAGHIGKALSHLGKMLDFEVTVIDDRHEYANSDNLPDADYIVVKDIGDAMMQIRKKQDTFIVIVTRGHNDDASALKSCIGSEIAYVGMIGSKGKVAKMHAEFVQKQWATEEQWSRIFTPVGLDIRAKTVEEIAVSIAAQLIQVRNRKR